MNNYTIVHNGVSYTFDRYGLTVKEGEQVTGYPRNTLDFDRACAAISEALNNNSRGSKGTIKLPKLD